MLPMFCSSLPRPVKLVVCSPWLSTAVPLILAAVCYLNGLGGELVHDDIFCDKRFSLDLDAEGSFMDLPPPLLPLPLHPPVLPHADVGGPVWHEDCNQEPRLAHQGVPLQVWAGDSAQQRKDPLQLWQLPLRHSEDRGGHQHYKTAISLAPDYAVSHNNLGTLLELEEAEFHFWEAVHHKPPHHRAFYNLCQNLETRGRMAEA